MSAVTEQNIRAAFAERASATSADATARLRAIDYQPRTQRRPTLPVIGVGVAVAMIVAAALVLLTTSTSPVVRPRASTSGVGDGSHPSIALTSWTAVPTNPTSTQIAAATRACNKENSRSGPAVMHGKPVLSEQRNAFTALIYENVSSSTSYICMSNGVLRDTALSSGQGLLEMYSPPGANQLEYPDNSGGSLQGFTGKPPIGYESSGIGHLSRFVRRGNKRVLRPTQSMDSVRIAAGLAGKNITAVSFAFSHGVTVKATVQNGWYFAWWPGDALPWHAKVTTSDGKTVTSPFPFSSSSCRDSTSHTCGAFSY